VIITIDKILSQKQ